MTSQIMWDREYSVSNTVYSTDHCTVVYNTYTCTVDLQRTAARCTACRYCERKRHVIAVLVRESASRERKVQGSKMWNVCPTQYTPLNGTLARSTHAPCHARAGHIEIRRRAKHHVSSVYATSGARPTEKRGARTRAARTPADVARPRPEAPCHWLPSHLSAPCTAPATSSSMALVAHYLVGKCEAQLV